MDIKPIETIYNGYRFRSRLEARWAVFFDTAGIQYEYETEGFDLGKNGWYLPDFYLKDFCWWVEVKGIAQKKEYSKLEALVSMFNNKGTFCQGVLVDGLPCEYFNGAHIFTNGSKISIAECACGYVTFMLEIGTRQMFAFNQNYGNDGCIRSHNNFKINTQSERIKKAFLAARQARFEHGEHGRILS